MSLSSVIRRPVSIKDLLLLAPLLGELSEVLA